MKIDRVPSTGATIELKLRGALNRAARTVFQEAIKEAREGSCQSIVLNLEKVTFLDGIGLALLILTHRELREAGISLSLKQAQGLILTILEVAKIPAIIPIQSP